MIFAILGFQVVWFACAWGAAHDQLWLAAVTSCIYLTHFLLQHNSILKSLKFLLFVTALGFCLDSGLIFFHHLDFPNPNPTPMEKFQPWWMTLLWISFAASCQKSFSWLIERRRLSQFLGLIAGPASYYAGLKMDALTLFTPTSAIVIGLFYVLFFPFFINYSQKIILSEPTKVPHKPE
jgi:hypothetical protein